jgi:hypothetical protein
MNFEQTVFVELSFANSPFKHDITLEYTDMLKKRDFIRPKTSISWMCTVTQIMIVELIFYFSESPLLSTV